MKLTEESAKRISDALAEGPLLDEPAAKQLVEALENDREVNWNIVLTKQFNSERKDEDEANS